MRINKKLGWVIFLGIQILSISILKNYPLFVEQFYSNGLYVFLSKIMRYVFGWLPFSVGDLLYTLGGIYIIRWLIINRKRIIKDTINWLLDIGATLSIAYFAFHGPKNIFPLFSVRKIMHEQTAGACGNGGFRMKIFFFRIFERTQTLATQSCPLCL